MAQYITVKNKKQLDALQIHSHGEIAYCEDAKELWIYDENQKQWVKYQFENKGIDLNLYDLNKSIIGQLNPFTPADIALKHELIEEYFNKSNNVYHMLLCKDYGYYTIFAYNKVSEFSSFAEAFFTIIIELGDIYSIELNADNAVEIWVKPAGEENPYAFYLFPYDAGVVYYG